jgi:hypothetical protein
MKKPPYHFKLRDFIPFNIGTIIYLSRTKDYNSDDIYEKSSHRAVGLFCYNILFAAGISAMAAYGAYKGLEHLLNSK